MKNMKKIGLYIVMAGLVFGSCVDLEQAPYSSLTPENFFKNEEDANAAVMAAYGVFANNTEVFNQFSEVIHSQGTDDCEWGSGRTTNNSDKNEFDKFTYTPESNLMYLTWKGYYVAVNVTNYAVDNILAMSDNIISDKKKRQHIAEAKFVRAYLYFNMVRYWKGVPLKVTETTSLDNLDMARNTEEEVYAQIIEDLLYAEENLPSVKEYAAADLGRASSGSASGMLAKVYLQREEWDKVISYTDKIISSGHYSLNASYADNFNLNKENGPESIFEVQYYAGTGNPGSIYNGYNRPPFVNINGFSGYGDDPVTKNLWDAYGANEDGTCDDTRRDVCVRLYTKAEYPNMSSAILYPYYCNKYIDLTPEAVRSRSGNNQPVIRYSDILLMKAEALGRKNVSDTEAYRYINMVRRRAYGQPIDQAASCDVSPVGTVNEFINIILHERRLELAFEANRWFDLVRTKKLKEAMTAQNPALGALVEDKHYMLAIPQIERDANPLLEQQELWK